VEEEGAASQLQEEGVTFHFHFQFQFQKKKCTTTRNIAKIKCEIGTWQFCHLAHNNLGLG
jgi:hypothetical protein